MKSRARTVTREIDEQSPTVTVVEAVASAKQVDSLDIATRLRDVVDTDALELLFDGSTSGFRGANGHIEFTFEECHVQIRAPGTVEVTPTAQMASD